MQKINIRDVNWRGRVCSVKISRDGYSDTRRKSIAFLSLFSARKLSVSGFDPSPWQCNFVVGKKGWQIFLLVVLFFLLFLFAVPD